MKTDASDSFSLGPQDPDRRRACRARAGNPPSGPSTAQGPAALLNEYFKNNPTTFDESLRWDVVAEGRNQWRARFTLEGELGWKPDTETYKATLSLQYNHFSMSKAEQLALSMNLKFTSKFTIPVFWRFELVPTYELQLAAINADAGNWFKAQRFELRANVPLFIRFGGGRFVQ